MYNRVKHIGTYNEERYQICSLLIMHMPVSYTQPTGVDLRREGGFGRLCRVPWPDLRQDEVQHRLPRGLYNWLHSFRVKDKHLHT